MKMIAWELTDEGQSLDIFEVDPITRMLTLILPLKRTTPMTEEEALKFVKANYPEDGNSVRMAAEALGILQRKT